MALFMDGPPSTFEDLRAHDSQLGDVASTEGVDVTQKLALAHEELGQKLEEMLDGRHPLTKVAVTTIVRIWHTYESLELVYRDAYFTHLNDRYKQKRNQFQELSRRTHDDVRHRGVGIVFNPVPKAATPVLANGAGDLPAASYCVTVSWVNAEGEEGSPAVVNVIDIQSGGFTVRPQGPAPASATGWNVYVGKFPEAPTLQNDVVLALEATWPQSGPPTTSGREPGTGQAANFLQPVPRFFPRA
jgi:hypothetical protein